MTSNFIAAIGHNPSYERNARPANFFVQPGTIPPAGTPSPVPYAQYAQYDNMLESGHSGAAQRMNQAGYSGYNNVICVA